MQTYADECLYMLTYPDVSEGIAQKSLNDLVFERGSEIGCTTIMIAHRLTTVEKADKIVVLDRGAIVESGTHSELKSKPNGFYAAMLAVQVCGLELLVYAALCYELLVCGAGAGAR